ncbi:MAG: formylglycine-generating enzyme family protein, partial [Dysgonamonadaceae bacterium]|nr:formylglycine-generating enzyme family protein [Dysgonamonadaceae bacterium]
CNVAWHSENNNKNTACANPYYNVTGPKPVRKKTQNDLGLYDMSGNLQEWCWDFYNTYTDEEVIDPIGPETASFQNYRVARGGGFNNGFECCVSYRSQSAPTTSLRGIRVVCREK